MVSSNALVLQDNQLRITLPYWGLIAKHFLGYIWASTWYEFFTAPANMILRHPIRIYRFYRDGFKEMTLGRTLWKVIIIKLIIMFAVLKLFFMPNFLQTNFSTDKQRADHVIHQLTESVEKHN